MPPQSRNVVSGPGALSRRTDGGMSQALQALPNAQYGENKDFQSLQQGAGLSQTPDLSGQAQPLPQNPAANQVVPASAPTARPNEPVTSGAAIGAGPGLSAIGQDPAQMEQQDIQNNMAKNMPLFTMLANMPDASPSARLMVNLMHSSV